MGILAILRASSSSREEDGPSLRTTNDFKPPELMISLA